MDFGTMRAKLHEGMYETLEQFEVFYHSLENFCLRQNVFTFPKNLTVSALYVCIT